ncbi:hypothetical protein DUNSADRAFT_17201 [Dunaliella salina]|uniref:Uncharacterized protein n=1 Tax=Dunaliella salina TaxID=3046 RepID=A0ABQ7G283_DUNSA|nr:hypothetical protein DUNSADRAFT_17201 [Dunaliella salina]|eukprot:KAF5828701.1 hypothetical protein DUNSADRAFT_17201 [Dunaliella salina]
MQPHNSSDDSPLPTLSGTKELLDSLQQAGSRLGLNEDEETKKKLEGLKQAMETQSQALCVNRDANEPGTALGPEDLERHLNNLEHHLDSLQQSLAHLDEPTQQILAESMKVWARQHDES